MLVILEGFLKVSCNLFVVGEKGGRMCTVSQNCVVPKSKLRFFDEVLYS